MIKNTYKGKFIVFEGLDGSGQSTQVKLLGDYLKNKKQRILLTKEPTQKAYASSVMPLIHDVLAHKKKISAHELQKLFSQDRKEHLENRVIPALKKNITVISDRYAFSSFAYGKASGLELDWLVKLNKNFLKPDICFFLNTNPKTCMNRINMRGNKHDLFEKHKTLKKVYKNFLLLAKQFDYIKIINGEKSIQDVFKQIKSFF